MRTKYKYILVLTHLIKRTPYNLRVLREAGLDWQDKPRRVSKLCYQTGNRSVQYFKSFKEASHLKKFYEYSYVLLAEDFKELLSSAQLLELQNKALKKLTLKSK